jgi:hypothetical protein
MQIFEPLLAMLDEMSAAISSGKPREERRTDVYETFLERLPQVDAALAERGAESKVRYCNRP